jgi:hypothetical protein
MVATVIVKETAGASVRLKAETWIAGTLEGTIAIIA